MASKITVPSIKTPYAAEKYWNSLSKKQQTRANARRVANKVGLRSMGEVRFAADLRRRRIGYKYEPDTIEYVPPNRRYKPDFKIKKSTGGYMYIEFKGNFTGPDRTKMLLVKKQHPDLDIRMIFLRASNKLNRRSKTTYAMWCDKHGFKWADGGVLPEEWRHE